MKLCFQEIGDLELTDDLITETRKEHQGTSGLTKPRNSMQVFKIVMLVFFFNKMALYSLDLKYHLDQKFVTSMNLIFLFHL